jgi:hypothetical protein
VNYFVAHPSVPVQIPVGQDAHVVAKLTFSRPPLRDCDNAYSSLKEVIDVLVTSGLLADDSPAHLTLGVVQVLGPHRGLTLEIWPWEVAP